MGEMALYLSCPALSHNWNLTQYPPTIRSLKVKSYPIGRYILSELVPHELTDERGLADRSAADKADFDKFVNLLGVFLENFQ